jgi:hypothetical protein
VVATDGYMQLYHRISGQRRYENTPQGEDYRILRHEYCQAVLSRVSYIAQTAM